MMRLQLIVTRTDGRRYSDHVERDDPAGRTAMDKIAFAMLAEPTVVSLEVIRTDRVAGFTGKAR